MAETNYDQKARNLHAKLTRNGYKVGSWDEFHQAMGDEKKRKALHRNLTSDGWKLGDYDTFSGIVTQAPAMNMADQMAMSGQSVLQQGLDAQRPAAAVGAGAPADVAQQPRTAADSAGVLGMRNLQRPDTMSIAADSVMTQQPKTAADSAAVQTGMPAAGQMQGGEATKAAAPGVETAAGGMNMADQMRMTQESMDVQGMDQQIRNMNGGQNGATGAAGGNGATAHTTPAMEAAGFYWGGENPHWVADAKMQSGASKLEEQVRGGINANAQADARVNMAMQRLMDSKVNDLIKEGDAKKQNSGAMTQMYSPTVGSSIQVANPTMNLDQRVKYVTDNLTENDFDQFAQEAYGMKMADMNEQQKKAVAQEMSDRISYQLFDDYKKTQGVKDGFGYVIQKALNESITGKVLGLSFEDNTMARQALAESVEDYGKNQAGWFTRFAGGVSPIIFDAGPFKLAGLGAKELGGWVGRKTGNLVAKAAARFGTNSAARKFVADGASKWALNNYWLGRASRFAESAAQQIVSGTYTMGNYNLASSIANGQVNLDNALETIGDSYKSGFLFSLAAMPGNMLTAASRKTWQAVGSAITGLGIEGSYMTWENLNQQADLWNKDHKGQEIKWYDGDWSEAIGHGMGMALFFKVQHAAGSPKEFYNQISGRSREEMDRRIYNNNRLVDSLLQSPDVEDRQLAINIIKSGAVGGLKWQPKYSEALRSMGHAGIVEKFMATGEMPDTSRKTIEKDFAEIMDDPNVPAEIKRSMAFAFGGAITPFAHYISKNGRFMATFDKERGAFSAAIVPVKDKEGKLTAYRVKAADMNGALLFNEDFKTKEEADKYAASLSQTIEDNNRYATEWVLGRATKQEEETLSEGGFSIEDFEENKRKKLLAEARAAVGVGDAALDDALNTPIAERKPEQQIIVDKYMNELMHAGQTQKQRIIDDCTDGNGKITMGMSRTDKKPVYVIGYGEGPAVITVDPETGAKKAEVASNVTVTEQRDAAEVEAEANKTPEQRAAEAAALAKQNEQEKDAEAAQAMADQKAANEADTKRRDEEAVGYVDDGNGNMVPIKNREVSLDGGVVGYDFDGNEYALTDANFVDGQEYRANRQAEADAEAAKVLEEQKKEAEKAAAEQKRIQDEQEKAMKQGDKDGYDAIMNTLADTELGELNARKQIVENDLAKETDPYVKANLEGRKRAIDELIAKKQPVEQPMTAGEHPDANEIYKFANQEWNKNPRDREAVAEAVANKFGISIEEARLYKPEYGVDDPDGILYDVKRLENAYESGNAEMIDAVKKAFVERLKKITGKKGKDDLEYFMTSNAIEEAKGKDPFAFYDTDAKKEAARFKYDALKNRYAEIGGDVEAMLDKYREKKADLRGRAEAEKAETLQRGDGSGKANLDEIISDKNYTFFSSKETGTIAVVTGVDKKNGTYKVTFYDADDVNRNVAIGSVEYTRDKMQELVDNGTLVKTEAPAKQETLSSGDGSRKAKKGAGKKAESAKPATNDRWANADKGFDNGAEGDEKRKNFDKHFEEQGGDLAVKASTKKYDPKEAVTPKNEAKDRPAMGGVHYEGGFAISSDARVLTIMKADYPAEWEGKTIGPDGKGESHNYPNWRMVLPKDMTKFKDANVSAEGVLNFLEAVMKKEKEPIVRINMGNGDVRAYNGSKLRVFMRAARDAGATFKYAKDGKLYFESEKGKGILMPMHIEDEGDVTVWYYTEPKDLKAALDANMERASAAAKAKEEMRTRAREWAQKNWKKAGDWQKEAELAARKGDEEGMMRAEELFKVYQRENLKENMDLYGFTSVKDYLEDAIKRAQAELKQTQKRTYAIDMDEKTAAANAKIDALKAMLEDHKIDMKTGTADMAENADAAKWAAEQPEPTDIGVVANDLKKAYEGGNTQDIQRAVAMFDRMAKKMSDDELKGRIEAEGNTLARVQPGADSPRIKATRAILNRMVAERKGRKNPGRKAKFSVKGKPGVQMTSGGYDVDDATFEAVDKIAKRFGLQVAFVDEVDNGLANASYADGTVLIEKGNPNPVKALLGHEVMHFIKEKNAAGYVKFATDMREAVGEFGWNLAMAEAKRLYPELDAEGLTEEVVANLAGDILNNASSLERFTDMADTGTLASLKRWVEGVKGWWTDDFTVDYSGKTGNIGGSSEYYLSQKSFKALERTLGDAYRAAQSRERLQEQSGIEATDGTATFGTMNGEQPATLAEARDKMSRKFAIQKGTKDWNDAVDDLMRVIGCSKQKAEKWLKSETSVAAMVGREGYAEWLDYQAREGERYIKKNSDYPQGTAEGGNICKKRRDLTDIYFRLQQEFPNRIFDKIELEQIRETMKEYGKTVACGLCFVEDRRQMMGEVAQEFIDNMGVNFEAYANKVVGGNTSATKKKNAAKINNILSGRKDKEFVPSIYDLITIPGRNRLQQEHPEVLKAFTVFNNARGQQAQRMFEDSAEYKREVLTWGPKKVRSVNNAGGLRIFSFSDFEAPHLIDVMQIISDCARKGVKIQCYTKVPAYARAIAKTGVKCNRSLIAKGKGYHYDEALGKNVLDYDTVEGIDINDPDFFDSTNNPDVGNILVGVNNEHIMLAMEDPFVDYIIPFHTGLDIEVLKKKHISPEDGWMNYKEYQMEKGMGGKHFNIYTMVLQRADGEGKPIRNAQEFTRKYLDVCQENGWTPKFDMFLERGKDGKWMPKSKGYYKLLLDFKMFDPRTGKILPHNTVKPEFDDAFNKEIMDRYVEEKTHPDPELDAVYDAVKGKINELGRGARLTMKDIGVDATASAEEIGEAVRSKLSRKVTDQAEIDRLENGKKRKAFHSMQLIEVNGERYLFPPMAAVVDGKYEDGIKVNPDGTIDPVWEMATENPHLAFRKTTDHKKIPEDAELQSEMETQKNGKQKKVYYWTDEKGVKKQVSVDDNGEPGYYFDLKKGNKGDDGEDLGDTPNVLYDPYQHSTTSPLNDQFASAYNRGHLVTVEVEIPEDEMGGSYKAERAGLATGEHDWKGGIVAKDIKGADARKVILSRYDKPFRIVPDSEVAENIKGVFERNGIEEMPFNVVTPSLRQALVDAGVKIGAPKGSGADYAMPAYEAWKENVNIGMKKDRPKRMKGESALDYAKRVIEYFRAKNGSGENPDDDPTTPGGGSPSGGGPRLSKKQTPKFLTNKLDSKLSKDAKIAKDRLKDALLALGEADRKYLKYDDGNRPDDVVSSKRDAEEIVRKLAKQYVDRENEDHSNMTDQERWTLAQEDAWDMGHFVDEHRSLEDYGAFIHSANEYVSDYKKEHGRFPSEGIDYGSNNIFWYNCDEEGNISIQYAFDIEKNNNLYEYAKERRGAFENSGGRGLREFLDIARSDQGRGNLGMDNDVDGRNEGTDAMGKREEPGQPATEGNGSKDRNETEEVKLSKKALSEKDKAYQDAVERGDMNAVNDMLMKEAEANGYSPEQAYKISHQAPKASVPEAEKTDLEAIKKRVEQGYDESLFAMANGVTNVPNDYFSQNGPRWYGYNYETYYAVNDALRRAKTWYEGGMEGPVPTITMYRAVPKDVNETMLRSGGQWVSPSKQYVKDHGRHSLDGYRIIKEEAPVTDVWFDGNDGNEWGYDDGKQYAYKNVKNGRKLLAPTYDAKGNLIPLSERFNESKKDVRYSRKAGATGRPLLPQTVQSEAQKRITELRDAVDQMMRGQKWVTGTDLKEKTNATKADIRRIAEEMSDFVQDRLSKEIGNGMTKMEVTTLLEQIKRAEATSDLREPMRQIQGMLNRVQMRVDREELEKILSTDMQKRSQNGVIVGTKVDVGMKKVFDDVRNTWAVLDTNNKAVKVDAQTMQQMITNDEVQVNDRIQDALANGLQPDDADLDALAWSLPLRRNAANAAESAEDMNAAKADMAQARQDLRDFHKTTEYRRAKGKQSLGHALDVDDENALKRESALRDAIWAAEDTYLQRQREVANSMYELTLGLKDAMGEGKERRKAWVQERVDRKQRIISAALADFKDKPVRMEGDPEPEDHKIMDHMTLPLNSLYFLLKNDQNHMSGQGGLYRWFFKDKDTSIIKAEETKQQGLKAYGQELNAAVERIFGKDFGTVKGEGVNMKTLNNVGDNAYERLHEDGMQPLGVDITRKVTAEEAAELNRIGKDNRTDWAEGDDYVVSGENTTKGHGLYLWLTWQQADGRMKMAKMGYDQDAVDQIEKALGPEYIEFAKWATDEFLPRLRRERYNPMYEEMYGTSMAENEHYFPLKLDRDKLKPKGGIEDGQQAFMPTSLVPNIIHRRRNTAKLDQEADAFEILRGYGESMEHWNAFAHVIEDANALYSSRSDSGLRAAMEANRKGSYKTLMEAFQVATGSLFQREDHPVSELMAKVASTWGRAKIAFRWYTAAKQLTSYPAFMTYSMSKEFHKELAKNFFAPNESQRWAYENLPLFQQRADNGDMGMEGFNDKGIFGANHRKLNRLGMAANRYVDRWAVAAGAKAVYNEAYRNLLKQHKAEGMEQSKAEETARAEARIEAEIAFNESQQSNVNAFSAKIQKDQGTFERLLMLFRNSPIGYGRRVVSGYKDVAKSFRGRTLNADGTPMTKAQRKKARWEAIANIVNFAAVLPTIWAMSGKTNVLWGGPDDDDKKSMMVATLLGSLTDYTTYGSWINTMAGGYKLTSLEVVDEINDIASNMRKNGIVATALDYKLLETVAENSIGIELETLANIKRGVIGLAKDAYEHGETMAPDMWIDFMTLMNMPKRDRKAWSAKLYKKYGPEGYAKGYEQAAGKANADNQLTTRAKEWVAATDKDFYNEMVEAAKFDKEYRKLVRAEKKGDAEATAKLNEMEKSPYYKLTGTNSIFADYNKYIGWIKEDIADGKGKKEGEEKIRELIEEWRKNY